MESESMDTPSPLTRKQAVKVALNDPAVKEQLARNPLVAQRRLLYSEGAVGLFVDLATVGFADLDEVGELRRRGVNYKGAVPILLEWLPRVTYLPARRRYRAHTVGALRKEGGFANISHDVRRASYS
jgi:hypothetical protein